MLWDIQSSKDNYRSAEEYNICYLIVNRVPKIGIVHQRYKWRMSLDTWFTSSLLIDVIHEHAPVKAKILKRASVPYMNPQPRKAIYRRNMARNKFRKYGSTYWEDNRIQRNKSCCNTKGIYQCQIFSPEMLFAWQVLLVNRFSLYDR